jgi:hypothetical protein
MELNGAIPHHIVWPKPEDRAEGKDRQISMAVKVLKKQVRKSQKTEQPKSRKASER